MPRSDWVLAVVILVVGLALGGSLGYLFILRPVIETQRVAQATNTPTPRILPTPSYTTYVVQSRDNLWAIADRFDTTVEAIMELNGLDSTLIYSGTQLLIPGGEISPSLMTTATPSDVPTSVPRPTNTLTPTSTPTAAPATATSQPSPSPELTQSPVGTKGNPVPRGQSWLTPDDWQIVVVGFNADAWPVIRAENIFNDPPAPGNRMVMARVGVTNVSVDPEPRLIGWRWFFLTGPRYDIYSTYDENSRCGVIPEELDVQLSQGEYAEGNVCFEIPSHQVDLWLLYEYAPGNYVFFAVE